MEVSFDKIICVGYQVQNDQKIKSSLWSHVALAAVVYCSSVYQA